MAEDKSAEPKPVQWGDDVLATPGPEMDTESTYTGWLSGLITSDSQPLSRPAGSDHFTSSGGWVARETSETFEVSSDEMMRAWQRSRPKKEESPTGEVGLPEMLSHAEAVEKAAKQPPALPPVELKLAKPPGPKPIEKTPPAPSAPERPAWAKPESLDDPPVPAWVAKLEAPSPSVTAPELDASKPPLKPPPTPPSPPPVKKSPVAVESVATSVPRRSLIQSWSGNLQRQRVTFYRSLTTMLGAGLPMFGVFDFLARESESPEQAEACRRISQDLLAGQPLHRAAYKEPALFSEIAVKLVEIGMRSGKLVAVLHRLAADEEHRWKLRQTLQSHLFYPLTIASLTLLAVVLLPPFVLADVLTQVVELSGDPPAITKGILWFSRSLSSPAFLITAASLTVLGFLGLRSGKVRERLVNLEPMAWALPGVGNLIQTAVSLRFLRIFIMTYDVGLTAPQCFLMAAEATGSRKATLAGPRMKQALIDGSTLRESLEVGDILPPLVIEAVEAGQQSGDVTGMMESVARIVDAELEYRIEALMSLVEPLFMAFLGICVGFFSIGCLLPILKMSESL